MSRTLASFLAGTPTTTDSASTSLVTSADAPTRESWPIVTPAMITACVAITAKSSTTTPCRMIRWRLRIVREHHIGKDPDEVPDRALLADMDVAVKPGVGADRAIALNIGERADAGMGANLCSLPNRHPMAELDAIANLGTCIHDRAGTQQDLPADSQSWVYMYARHGSTRRAAHREWNSARR